MIYKLNTGNYTELKVTARKQGALTGWIKIYLEQICVQDYYYKYNGFETGFLKLKQGYCYDLEIENLDISLMYLSGSPDILEDGVIFLEPEKNELRTFDKSNMGECYNQSFRNQFHFAPYKNWMNDPNGLCFFQGYYHMFYQYHPNSPVWGNMHWGHAVSRDCIHWTHQPIAFYPQIELLDNNGFRGGAFSGSAIVKENTMYLYFTRHFGRLDRIWQRQWQVLSSTGDGIHFSSEEPVIWGTPEGVFYDFRDPKVTYIDNCYHMVLGGTVYDRPAVLHYISENLTGWIYKGVLYQETDPAYHIIECPDFFPLGGKYILVVGYLYASHISGNPRRDTRYYIGCFSDDVFRVEQSGIYDFGKDFYAVQSFEHSGRRISMGWNCTGQDYYCHEPNSSNGTLGLPRQLTYENELLLMNPIEECQQLLAQTLLESESGKTFAAHSPQEYQLVIQSEKALSGYVQLACGDGFSATLSISGNLLSLDTGTGGVCEVPIDTVKRLEVYVDRSLIEIFINHGRWTCTRRYYLPNRIYEISGQWNHSCRVKITALKSIWQ